MIEWHLKQHLLRVCILMGAKMTCFNTYLVIEINIRNACSIYREPASKYMDHMADESTNEIAHGIAFKIIHRMSLYKLSVMD